MQRGDCAALAPYLISLIQLMEMPKRCCVWLTKKCFSELFPGWKMRMVTVTSRGACDRLTWGTQSNHNFGGRWLQAVDSGLRD